MTITPVQLSGNEIYEILKKRLIDELPDEATISDIAEEYAQQVKKAEDGGYIVASSTGLPKGSVHLPPTMSVVAVLEYQKSPRE